jgi:acyl dehydratase
VTPAPTRLHDDVVVGEVLPELALPLSRTFIVATAIASRDYQDVHHDPGLAQERGSEDVFMNILTTNGLVGRYVTDWSGPGGVLEQVCIRLGAPNYPGDTMTFTGSVAEVHPPDGRTDGRATVLLSVRGANSRGDHVTGTVRVALPRRDAVLQPLPAGGHAR